MWFDLGRSEGFPTQYPPNQTPVTVDVLEAGFIAAFIILLLSLLVLLPTSSLKKTLCLFVEITTLLTIGLLLLLGNFGQEWEVGHILTRTPYKAGSSAEINASIGLKIGLRSVNVTLKSDQNPPNLAREIINYNERFSWTWDQDRLGFGPFAGHLQQEFRAAQYRGLPTPILWVVEYFVIDGEGFRFGRFYRTAGWYSHVALWCAFACWLVALLLFRSVILYGGYCLAACGALQLTANLIWLVVRNPIPLVVPFEDGTITTRFGLSYWITFASGILCLVIAIIITLLDTKFHTLLYTFFGVDPLNSYDEVAYLTKNELLLRTKNISNDVPLIPMSNSPKEEEDDSAEYVPVYIKRKTRAFGPPVVRSNKPKHLLEM
ncbi:Dual oxidase maturation factor 1-like Protein [Tribolium castaneum]|uniref:Dual oxidase maturation factor 1-like Protein n=1 Tax=Tribolium castaneum TaxID=7070 RepID=D6WVX0_TRICA|nr:PREDICTED: dual oxidase maturation factor 1 [Tribolium castaneum]EFA08225.1 Dual oxidase maturation factor 1-like Protein [Tribolium castaneum]|eukprot:XP_971705.1 PREDICTED: dual oxidase maturation factor 1 [Tribolium castaneum]